MTGTRLLQYYIDAELGRGGMGIVYRATDTKLNRTVALKVLPAAALASEEDRARFFREAQAAAQLSHPNIAGVHQIDEAIPVDDEGREVGAGDGKRPFIAMEFIDGETLAEHVKKGPMPLKTAVGIAGQIAEALKAAHAKGIVHRDIKSANVMLTPEGVAKVLDFGLAKTNQSTMLTRMGSTLGTVAYMSPEQARGQEVDGRSDLYSLGTMLYEMVAGRLPFAGDYEQAVVYRILNEAPEPLTSVRTGVPMQLEWLVNKLLAKEAEYRYQSATDLLVDLKSLDIGASGHSRRSMPAMEPAQVAATPGPWRVPRWAWILPVALLAAGFAAAWLLMPRNQGGMDGYPTVHSEFRLGDGRIPQALTISPDGTLLAYSDAADGAVFVRNLETGEERVIPGTSGIVEMDFSPDGQWLLLDEIRAILRVAVSGGSPARLHSTSNSAPHSSWVDNERILFDDAAGIWQMTLSSGTISPVVLADTLAGEIRLIEGRISPDGTRLSARIIPTPAAPGLGIYAFPGGELIAKTDFDAVSARYLASGHLVYLTGADLMVRPFDIASGQVLGPAVRVASGMSETNWDLSAWGQLVYGPIAGYQFSLSVATVPKTRLGRGSSGTVRPLPMPEGRYSNLRVSPDGRRLVAAIREEGASSGDLWVIDLATGVSDQVTFGRSGDAAAWSPDGDSLAVSRYATAGIGLVVQAADGSGKPRVVATDSEVFDTPDWSKAAGRIALVGNRNDGQWSIWLLDPYSTDERLAVPNLERSANPVFSPNGRYMAFEKAQRIVVSTVEPNGGEWDVSQGRGGFPSWDSDGSAIYFADGGDIMRVPVDTEGSFRRLGPPELMVSSGLAAVEFVPIPNTDEFILTMPLAEDEQENRVPVQIITNATEMIGRLAPRPR